MKKNREFYKIPDWFYSDGLTCYLDGNREGAGNRHDWEYWLGGTKIDKENADENFFHNVENTGGNKLQSFLNRYYHCFIVYFGVKFLGQKPFEERDKKLDENDPLLEEIYYKERYDDYIKRVYQINKEKKK